MIAALLLALAALAYSAVGHAGASGYLAVMALLGTPAATMRPTALLLNLVVATIGTVQFTRAGHFRWSLFWPFAITSIPMALVGGRLTLPESVYGVIVGSVLLLSALRLVLTRTTVRETIAPPPPWIAMLAGAGLGLLSGLTGVGGGIFLSPLLLFCGWADMRTTAATSVAFILVNSAAGLLGQLPLGDVLPPALPLWIGAVVVGGGVGATLGSRKLPLPVLRVVLALVLTVAGAKMISGVLGR
ncbi:MAG: sulfite exporter TauE/SafE family protein [Gemmatimonadales bacterium]